jgi:predicted nucleic acid-binding protein
MRVFIDSNVPMYAAGRPHPHRDPSVRFLRRVQAGDVEGCTSTEVLQEILYRYSALNLRDIAARVYDLFVEICPTVLDVTLADTDAARSLLLEVPGVSARDAVHAAVMRNHGIDRIASFDRGFDEVAGIRRIDVG